MISKKYLIMVGSKATMSVTEAVKFLNRYSFGVTTNDDQEEIKQLKEAIAIIIPESAWENIGICADNFDQGWKGLQNYLKALGCQRATMQEVPEDPEEPVYIKFNTQKMSYYTSSYPGTERGALIATQGDEETVLGTFGYFPLELFS